MVGTITPEVSKGSGPCHPPALPTHGCGFLLQVGRRESGVTKHVVQICLSNCLFFKHFVVAYLHVLPGLAVLLPVSRTSFAVLVLK